MEKNHGLNKEIVRIMHTLQIRNKLGAYTVPSAFYNGPLVSNYLRRDPATEACEKTEGPAPHIRRKADKKFDSRHITA
jgi:hypothetical protein